MGNDEENTEYKKKLNKTNEARSKPQQLVEIVKHYAEGKLTKTKRNQTLKLVRRNATGNSMRSQKLVRDEHLLLSFQCFICSIFFSFCSHNLHS